MIRRHISLSVPPVITLWIQISPQRSFLKLMKNDTARFPVAILLAAMFLQAFGDQLAADDLKSELSAENPKAVEFFENRIRPVLVKHCYECHAVDAKNVKGGLLLDTRAASRKGGDSGAAVVPGDVDESLIITSLKHESFEMPPKGKLADTVIADFVKWVKMGAPDPRDGEIVESQIDFDEARKFWSFQPVQKREPPTVKDTNWPKGNIDYFTLAKMEQLRLKPMVPAGKRELIRRATFDLVGLPPAPAVVDAFLADDSPDAFSRVIDRLLDSEHYGERWGRYWLDVARYAEDQAHTFGTRANTNGYRFRDWVIRAFNADLPYDQFVRMQIAGDLIDTESRDKFDGVIAMGFFGLGAQYYKNSDKAKAMADELDDRVDTLTRGFLGLTVSCARCHDHKFDPIPTQDYYSLAGIFNSSRLHNAPLCTPEEMKAYNEGQKSVRQASDALKKNLAESKSSLGESMIYDFAKYIEAAWVIHAAQANRKPVKTADVARARSLNEAILKRWVSFLATNQKGKVNELDDWFAIDIEKLKASKDEIPREVTDVAIAFQKKVQLEIHIRDGGPVENLVKDGETRKPGSPRFVSPLVTKARPTAAIDVDIRGAKRLILVITEGNDGKSCDHADWLAPILVGPAGKLKLTELKWKHFEGTAPKFNTNFAGQPIRVGGKKYPEGIGTHATSVITWDLPEGYERFKATGGLDNSGSDQVACGSTASVQFCVYTETPTSGPFVSKQKSNLLATVFGQNGPFAVNEREIEALLSDKERNRLAEMKAEVEAAKKSAPAMYAVAHSYAESRIADMKVFVRGNPERQREVAPRRFLQVIAGVDRPHYTEGSGRRQLAAAIANSENPLTARVMVNRIWQHHFGRGIVATPSNFGKLGDAPTHPELLDYLASRFIESGWSIKMLHREIMLSATWQLSTQPDESNAQIDADNRYLWQMTRRRLDIEAWRDAVLDVSGRLDRSFGGPSTNLADANNVRRTVYAKVSRHNLDSLLRLFDFPDANITSSKRSETTVPQQQLFVLNSPFMIAQAKAFSTRLHNNAPENDEARINLAFRLAYGRPPEDIEVELARSFVSGGRDPQSKLSRWESYAQVLLGSNEFMYLD